MNMDIHVSGTVATKTPSKGKWEVMRVSPGCMSGGLNPVQAIHSTPGHPNCINSLPARARNPHHQVMSTAEARDRRSQQTSRCLNHSMYLLTSCSRYSCFPLTW